MRKFLALRAASCLVLPAVGLSAACGDDEGARSRFPYASNETVLIGAGAVDVQRTPSGQACVTLQGGVCVRPQVECGEGAYADVLLDSSGALIEVVCLPLEKTTGLVDVENGAAALADNGSVVILDDRDLDGDITVAGNRGVIFGESPAEAIIDGNLVLRGNESTVRGVTVTGDVTFDGNASDLYYCVVYGDVILKGNGNLVSNCTVYGSIIGSGNDDRLISNFADGTISVGGEPAECRDNRAFDDADRDLFLDAEEASAAGPLDCIKK